MDTSTPLYQTLQCLGAIPIFVVVYVAWAWLTSGGNGANVPPEKGDGIIRSDVPGHPEYATQRAAEIVNQRETGGVKYWGGDEREVYVNSDPDNADWHSQQRHIDYMTENGRAARNGVKVHKVSAAERDRISAMRGSGSGMWHNTAETSPITETHSGGMSDGAKLAAGCFMVAITGGVGIVCAIVLATR